MRLFDNLTAREEQVLALVAQGEDNKAIAHALCISIFTVQNNMQSLFQRLEVHNRTEAAGKYWQHYASAARGK